MSNPNTGNTTIVIQLFVHCKQKRNEFITIYKNAGLKNVTFVESRINIINYRKHVQYVFIIQFLQSTLICI